MLREFREFIMRGNVFELAVAVIMGAAFGPIVSSLVNDIVMPPIGLLLGNTNFANLFVLLKGGTFETLAAAQEAGAVTINYGIFINAVINFLVVAFVVFLLVRQVNRLKKKEEAAPAAPPAPSNEEVLLGEIRDLLKAQQ